MCDIPHNASSHILAFNMTVNPAGYVVCTHVWYIIFVYYIKTNHAFTVVGSTSFK